MDFEKTSLTIKEMTLKLCISTHLRINLLYEDVLCRLEKPEVS